MRLELRESGVSVLMAREDLLTLVHLLNSGFNVAGADDATMTLANGSFRLKCRLGSGFDLGHINEIFVQKTYGTDFRDKVVLDIGASNGDSSVWFALCGAKRVIALEPYPESYRLALDNVRMNGLDDKITVLNLALSSVKSKADFAVSSRSPNANALAPTEHIVKSLHIVFDGSVTIETTTVPELISYYSISRVDYLKLDCEGCEYDVLRNLAGEVWPLINEIVLEYHNGLSDLAELMERHDMAVISDGGDEVMGILHAVRNRSRD
ncbi:MAG: FkbM family methyltransferase [Thermoplasmata archaeon]|uniref:FkbM family methyltransferase n=1 Tax=Candidatus Sysuiplasma superficiale TaxID=2823368 RepID=A0A8J7YQ95_9ARCH|nr:FkbM family methyltransferase [Candidatus Sysuiplasma superficiale]